MIKTIHIKLLLIISLSILFGHSALGQNFPTFVATQNVCVNEEVTYTGYGLDGSQLFFDIYESDGSTVVSLGNVLTLADPPVTVMSGADMYYKYEFVNYKWLTPGTYVVKIREVTSSGCEGGNATDLTVVVSPLPDISSLSFNVSTPVCKNTSPVFTVSGLSPATAYSIGYDDNGVSKIVNVTTDGSGSCSLPVDAIDATATYNVESVAFNDGSANCAASPAPSLTAETSLIENTPPTITAPAAISVNVDAGTCGAASSGVTLGTPTTADNCGVASTINDAPLTFPIGNTTVTWTVTDNSGLTATDTQIVTVVDNISPTITAPADVAVNSDAGDCTASSVVLGTPVTSDNCTVASVTSDAPAVFPLGETTVTWTVTDGSGLQATATQKVTVTDNQNPTITAPADVAVNSDAGICTASSVVLGAPVTADNCSVASVTSDAPAVFPLGETTVTWTVTDGSGLQATATQKVTVTDNQNPTITAPADVAVNSDAGICTASSVVLGAPVTADNCSVASVTSDASAVFPLGETTVTWTVTDGSGLQATATQKVTVTDNQNPTITAPAAISVNVDAGTCGAASSGVTLGTPTTADNCGVASTINDAPLTFPIGNTTVTWTVTDNSGLTATDTQIVTVVDNISPTITAPADVAVNSDVDNCTASLVTLGTPSTADNCSVASVNNDAPAIFPLGETTVTWTVMDGSGLQATATQKVTVTDNQAPVFSSCPSSTVIWAEDFNNYSNFTYQATNAGTTWQGYYSYGLHHKAAAVGGLLEMRVEEGANVEWLTNYINISSESDVQVSFDLSSWAGSAADGYIEFWARVDGDQGGTYQLFKTISGAVSNQVVTSPVFNGDKLELWIRVVKGSSVGIYYVDNISLIAPMVKNVDPNQCTYTVQGTEFNVEATDNCTLSSLNYNLTGATTGTGTNLNGQIINQGLTTITWTATDASSNEASCSFDVVIVDNEEPMLADLNVIMSKSVCPNDGDEGNTPQTAVVTGLNLTADLYSDNCTADGNLIIQYKITLADNTVVSDFGEQATGAVSTSDPSGYAFKEGITTVSYKIIDEATNESEIKSFTVTVKHKPNSGSIEY
ncbi:HYR domain-containing protein [Ancylomarina subtilis]|uniref:HYR domain-containing protein n=1 Tax=Ancylomarina subtilis TaxID=1639035 RepID=A0A4Q7VCS6_9BACT|nr:HYR domain-containing protein [Ancylomarina subtilis]RZT93143.1 HYR domain-containing protein [Ancylomarina subtilis]